MRTMAITCLFVVAGTVCRAEGQTTRPSAAVPPKRFVQIAALAVVQPRGTPNHRVHPAIGGQEPGASIAGGFYLGRGIAVEGEAVVATAFSAQQQFSYNWREDYRSESRDALIGANIRVSPSDWRWLELFGGGGLAISTFRKRSIVRTEFFPTRTILDPDRQETSTHPYLGGGMAFDFRRSSRVSVVPAVSFRWIQRESFNGLAAYMGAGGRVVHIGLALRFR